MASKTIFIVAGTYEEFRRLTRSHNNLELRLLYVHQADDIRGYRGIRVDFTNDGFKRKDILDIYQNILLCNIGTEFEDSYKALKLDILLYA